MENLAQLEALASRIRLGNCVLVLGPGASTDSTGEHEMPIHEKFARELAASLSREQKRDLNADDLRHVSQVWQEKNRNSALLQGNLRRFYKQFSGQTTDFHRNLAALPYRLCITTTPDDFLFNALTEAGKKPIRDFYNFRETRAAFKCELTVDRPLVYHLYGYHDEPSSLVITENDLIDFLTGVIRKAPSLPDQITGTISRPDSNCLFVDLGFKNWYLRVLMRSLGLLGHNEKSVALESREFFAQSKQHQTMVYFSSTNTMEFHQESLGEFAVKLRRAYESIADQGSRQAAALPPDAPVVFLSYASEDRELIERLGLRLRSAGIAVWQDKQNLRAGDNWERIITHVIEKQVDYFVAVQTPAMAERVRGVFYQEIEDALLQQKRTREGIRFLIPVHSSDQDRLTELSHLHSTSIATDDGVKDLIHSIAEDWTARKAQRNSRADAVGS